MCDGSIQCGLKMYLRFIFALALLLILSAATAADNVQVPQAELPPYTQLWFTQTLDHYNFATRPLTFQQRYLVVDKYWTKRPNAPFLFYSGNEGDIFMFFNNTGYLFNLAQIYGAYVVFAEHRFYGQSLPFGDQSFTAQNMQFLTVEQALADFAVLITDIKKKDPLLSNSPVVTIGGSYGGMLSTWFRIKYPHIVEAAFASSAPIVQIHGIKSDYSFYKIVTDDYRAIDPNCSQRIRKSFDVIQELADAGKWSELTRIFRTCRPLATQDDIAALNYWIMTAFSCMAMTDYPYATNFMLPLPAWPVRASCQPILQRGAHDLLGSIRDGASVYWNTSGIATCFDIWSNDLSPSLGMTQWAYQTCTEIVQAVATNGVTDMFPPAPYDLKAIIEGCEQQFGVIPRVDWMVTWFGGLNMSASNILFSNGNLDPWSGGGVTESLSDTLIAINIENSAHHLDLRFPNPADPPSVVQARKQEAAILKKWLDQYYSEHNMINPML